MTVFYNIYKPKGITSHDVISKLRKITGEKTIGHAGTLDPLAEGVLIVAIGREMTKQIKEIVGQEKEYVATVKLGETSTTDDEEGEKTKVNFEKQPDRKDIENCLRSFLGIKKQVPPIFSALKISGSPAYKLARQGKEIKMEPREVELKRVEIIDFSRPYLKIKIVTGSGFYVRALARDLGQALGTGAYLTDLKRTRIGDFKIEDAIKIEDFKGKFY